MLQSLGLSGVFPFGSMDTVSDERCSRLEHARDLLGCLLRVMARGLWITAASGRQGSGLEPYLNCRYAHPSFAGGSLWCPVHEKLNSLLCNLPCLALIPTSCFVQAEERLQELCCWAGPLLLRFLWKRKFQAAYAKHRGNTAAQLLRRQAGLVHTHHQMCFCGLQMNIKPALPLL